MSKRLKQAKINDDAKAIREKLAEHLDQPGHKMPQTRREFLSTGLIALGTQLMAPSLLSLVGRSAHAAEIMCPQPVAGLPTLINLQLAGGPALFANHLAHGPGGTPYDKYGILGVGTNPRIEKYFANNAPFYAPDPVATGRPGSGFLRGLKQRMGSQFDTIIGGADAGGGGKAVFVSVACKSIDDRFTNQHGIEGLLRRVGGGAGMALPHILCEAGGRNRTANVGKGVKRFQPAYYPEPSYLNATTAEAMQAAIGFKGALQSQLGSTTQESVALQQKIVEIISDMNRQHIEALTLAPSSREGRIAARKLAHCAGQVNLNNLKRATNSSGFDIYQDSALAAIWARNFTNATGSFDGALKNDMTGQMAVTVTAALKGLAPAVTIAVGGYDYHTNQLTSRIGQDNHDIFFGETVGNILLTAEQLGKPVFLYISTDGSVSSPTNQTTPADVAWQGDYGQRGMNYIIAYHPTMTPQTRGYNSKEYNDGNFQLNHFAEVNDGSFRDFYVANINPIAATSAQDLAAAAVFLNYLEFAGQKSLIDIPEMELVKSKLVQGAQRIGTEDIFAAFSRIMPS